MHVVYVCMHHVCTFGVCMHEGMHVLYVVWSDACTCCACVSLCLANDQGQLCLLITNTSNSTIKPKGDAQYSERKPTTKTMLFTGTCLA